LIFEIADRYMYEGKNLRSYSREEINAR